MDKFDKNETMLIVSNEELDNYNHAIYADPETGMKVATTYNLHVLPANYRKQRPSEVRVLKHVWVDVNNCGEIQPCYVESFESLPRLIEVLLQGTHESNVDVRASDEFIKAGIVNL